MIVYTGQYNENKSDLLNLDLEPVMASLKAKEGIDQYIKCYAAIEELKNTFLVRSDIEIELRFDSSGNIYTDRYGQKFYDSFINPQIDNKVFTLNYNHVFFSEQKLEVIQLPAFYHETPFDNDFYSVIGSFDISSWLRPLQPGYINKNYDKEKTILVKRGDPLYYVKFKTKENIKLKRFDVNSNILKYIDSCVGYKAFDKKSNLQKLYKIFSKHKYNKKILKEIKNNLL